ncbi:hypothetical protein [Thiohalocapsa sp.]|uniref:hypothetical protein n=1 Tax=Thiohalocapsa sp. TaxID=2497641 RepID=UPI0025D3BE1F|nr:hypothetical protein [Thiohalocapsa sp.]
MTAHLTERERARDLAIKFQFDHVLRGIDRSWSREREREMMKNGKHLALQEILDNSGISGNELRSRFGVSYGYAQQLLREFGSG